MTWTLNFNLISPSSHLSNPFLKVWRVWQSVKRPSLNPDDHIFATLARHSFRVTFCLVMGTMARCTYLPPQATLRTPKFATCSANPCMACPPQLGPGTLQRASSSKHKVALKLAMKKACEWLHPEWALCWMLNSPARSFHASDVAVTDTNPLASHGSSRKKKISPDLGGARYRRKGLRNILLEWCPSQFFFPHCVRLTIGKPVLVLTVYTSLAPLSGREERKVPSMFQNPAELFFWQFHCSDVVSVLSC